MERCRTLLLRIFCMYALMHTLKWIALKIKSHFMFTDRTSEVGFKLCPCHILGNTCVFCHANEVCLKWSAFKQHLHLFTFLRSFFFFSALQSPLWIRGNVEASKQTKHPVNLLPFHFKPPLWREFLVLTGKCSSEGIWGKEKSKAILDLLSCLQAPKCKSFSLLFEHWQLEFLTTDTLQDSSAFCLQLTWKWFKS